MKFYILILAVTSTIFAHGVGFKLETSNSAQIVSFHYSGGEPMAYVDVLVYDPHNSDVEFQNGRTDRNGNFAFVPDSEGVWIVKAEDAKGHMGDANVIISKKKGDMVGKLLQF